MTKVSDFVRIRGDVPKDVPVLVAGAREPLSDFDTTDRLANEPAVLMYVMRGPFAGIAAVEINGVVVGAVAANAGAGVSTQIMGVNGDTLNNGSNTISILGPSNDFKIQDVYLHYHKSV